MRQPGDGEDAQGLREQGFTFHEIGDFFDVKYEAIRKRAQRWRAQNPDAQPLVITNMTNSQSTQKQITIADQGWSEWSQHHNKLTRMNRLARLAFWTDVHLPFQDDRAIELAAKVTEDFDPDIVTALSDDFDFPGLSVFTDTRNKLEDVWDDDLGNMLFAHRRLMNIKRDAAPNAVFPALPGNHDDRIIKYTRTNAASISEYVIASFLKDIADNGVLWMGRNLHNNIALMLNNQLMILHGQFATKVLETTMKKHLEMYGWQTSVMFGHIHRSGSRWWRGLHYDVQAISSPCLCRLDPHYTNRHVDWQQGIVLTQLDPKSGYHDSTIVDFVRHNGYLVARYGDKEYRVKSR